MGEKGLLIKFPLEQLIKGLCLYWNYNIPLYLIISRVKISPKLESSEFKDAWASYMMMIWKDVLMFQFLEIDCLGHKPSFKGFFEKQQNSLMMMNNLFQSFFLYACINQSVNLYICIIHTYNVGGYMNMRWLVGLMAYQPLLVIQCHILFMYIYRIYDLETNSSNWIRPH